MAPPWPLNMDMEQPANPKHPNFKVPFYNYLVVILIGDGVLSWILKNTILWIFSESPPNLGRFHYEFTLTPAGGVGFAVGHGVGRVS